MNYKIPRAFVTIEPDEIAAAVKVLKSGKLVKGPEVLNFEKEFSDFIGVKHAIAVNSGTSALVITLSALGIPPKCDVITVPNTFVATANAISYLRAYPVFVDVSPTHYTMSSDRLAEAITLDTDAIIPVHLYGQACPELDRILAVAKEYGIPVIEDACQAHGASYRRMNVGSFGDAGIFSFFPTKNMTVGGDGGMIVTNNDSIATTTRAIRDQGRDQKGITIRCGINFRMGEVMAAIGRIQLEKLTQRNAKRKELARLYKSRLVDCIQVTSPTHYSDAEHVYHLFMLLAEQRDKLRSHLQLLGIETSLMYPKLITENPFYHFLTIQESKDFPNAVKINQTALALPMYPQLGLDNLYRITNHIKSFYSEI